MTKFYTWDEFDKNVEFIADKFKFSKFSGIFGIPRGGLCLAVALSHKLNVKLLSEPIKNSLIVDDIYETGLTLNSFKKVEGATFFVLFSKKVPTWWNTLNLSDQKEWIVFPWENKNNLANDRRDYLKKRGNYLKNDYF